MPKKEKPPDIRRLLYIFVEKSLDLEKSGFFANQAFCNAPGVNLVSSIGNSLADGGYFVVPKIGRGMRAPQGFRNQAAVGGNIDGIRA